MSCRTIALCLIIILVSFALSAGCTSLSPASTGTIAGFAAIPGATGSTAPAVRENTSYAAATPDRDRIAEELASVKSDNPIWSKAYHMYTNMKTTRYSHNTSIDEGQGIYQFDCLGFVNSVVMNADPEAYHGISLGFNASILSYAAYFGRLENETPDKDGWMKVAHPANLKPGDICLWLKPNTFDDGHMWIIAGESTVNPKRSAEVLVRILDSTPHVHSDDSRTVSVNRTGLGTGILGMMVDGQGDPTGLYWDGGVSTSAGEMDTTIVCGRLNK